MQGIKYSVDIVLCIDATGSMESIINNVKNNALKFYDDLSKNMQEKNKSIDNLRVRVIVFRDYYVDGKNSMIESEFFSLPQDKENFFSFVNDIEAEGGGDEPENGLEALALAIKSDWHKDSDRRRQIIVVWTDASAHKLEKDAGSKPVIYPNDLPKDFNEITDMWEGQGSYVSNSAKRLIIYAPDAYPWTDINDYWGNIVHYSSRAGEGLADVDYQEIITAIANSV